MLGSVNGNVTLIIPSDANAVVERERFMEPSAMSLASTCSTGLRGPRALWATRSRRAADKAGNVNGRIRSSMPRTAAGKHGYGFVDHKRQDKNKDKDQE